MNCLSKVVFLCIYAMAGSPLCGGGGGGSVMVHRRVAVRRPGYDVGVVVRDGIGVPVVAPFPHGGAVAKVVPLAKVMGGQVEEIFSAAAIVRQEQAAIGNTIAATCFIGSSSNTAAAGRVDSEFRL